MKNINNFVAELSALLDKYQVTLKIDSNDYDDGFLFTIIVEDDNNGKTVKLNKYIEKLRKF